MNYIISSRTDIEIYVGNEHPDFCEHNLDNELVDAIQNSEHPDYGNNWNEWFEINIDTIRETVIAKL